MEDRDAEERPSGTATIAERNEAPMTETRGLERREADDPIEPEARERRHRPEGDAMGAGPTVARGGSETAKPRERDDGMAAAGRAGVVSEPATADWKRGRRTEGATSNESGRGALGEPSATVTREAERLREAQVAFEIGDYARVRELVRELQGSADPQVADQALDLARRVAVDPWQMALLIACAIAWCVIFGTYVLHS